MSNNPFLHRNLPWPHIGFCSSITGPKILSAALTSLKLTGLQRPICEFPCSCQIYFSLEESLRIHLVAIPVRLAAFHLVLNLMDFTSLIAHKIVRQANHILQQEQRDTSPSCYNQACLSHGHFWFTVFLGAT